MACYNNLTFYAQRHNNARSLHVLSCVYTRYILIIYFEISLWAKITVNACRKLCTYLPRRRVHTHRLSGKHDRHLVSITYVCTYMLHVYATIDKRIFTQGEANQRNWFNPFMHIQLRDPPQATNIVVLVITFPGRKTRASLWKRKAGEGESSGNTCNMDHGEKTNVVKSLTTF